MALVTFAVLWYLLIAFVEYCDVLDSIRRYGERRIAIPGWIPVVVALAWPIVVPLIGLSTVVEWLFNSN